MLLIMIAVILILTIIIVIPTIVASRDLSTPSQPVLVTKASRAALAKPKPRRSENYLMGYAHMSTHNSYRYAYASI